MEDAHGPAHRRVADARPAGAPAGFAPGTFSTGTFASGNLIDAIGLDLDGPASNKGSTFGLTGRDFQAASALGAGDGRVSLSAWGRTGDLSMWLDGQPGNGPANLAVLTADGTAYSGPGSFTNLAGGVGSGVSYEFAFRQFRSGGAGGAIQLFFDLTACRACTAAAGPTTSPAAGVPARAPSGPSAATSTWWSATPMPVMPTPTRSPFPPRSCPFQPPPGCLVVPSARWA